MAEQKANQELDIQKLLAEQEKRFQEQLKAQQDENAKKLEALVTRNEELAQELTNLKTNTAEENALLGEKINAVAEVGAVLPKYNPYKPELLYEVKNEVAGITTIMTGDEVEGIVGIIQTHLTKKLIEGAKEIEKHPYKIKLLGTIEEYEKEKAKEEQKANK